MCCVTCGMPLPAQANVKAAKPQQQRPSSAGKPTAAPIKASGSAKAAPASKVAPAAGKKAVPASAAAAAEGKKGFSDQNAKWLKPSGKPGDKPSSKPAGKPEKKGVVVEESEDEEGRQLPHRLSLLLFRNMNIWRLLL